MHLRRTAALTTATALALLIPTADAHAIGIACGGGVSTGRVAVNGCISAQRWKDGKVFFRDVAAYAKLRNTGPRGVNVSYEAFFRIVSGGHWVKIGSGRTYVAAGVTEGPTAIGDTSRACGPFNVKAEIRVHAKADGGVWSNWSTAATTQCQT
ncbi:hypothetical protein ACIBCO_36645 [Streptomyces violascens]|uniref:hypothetical protein n=1 Tax=Streptomyces violascens TaxID=67381 RepID=UPI003791D65C